MTDLEKNFCDKLSDDNLIDYLRDCLSDNLAVSPATYFIATHPHARGIEQIGLARYAFQRFEKKILMKAEGSISREPTAMELAKEFRKKWAMRASVVDGFDRIIAAMEREAAK